MFNRKERAFTLFEMMIAMTIVTILTALAVPSFIELIDRKRLESSAEDFYGEVKFAHSETIKRGTPIFVSIKTGSDWCFGMSAGASCDCQTDGACTVDGGERRFRAADYPNVTMSTTGFTTASGITFIGFDTVRGTTNVTGSVTFTSPANGATVNVFKLGNPSICSDDLMGYTQC